MQGEKKKIEGKFEYWRESFHFSWENLKKKSPPEKFYEQYVQNIAYFNTEKKFPIRKNQKIDKIDYSNKKVSKNRIVCN